MLSTHFAVYENWKLITHSNPCMQIIPLPQIRLDTAYCLASMIEHAVSLNFMGQWGESQSATTPRQVQGGVVAT